MIKKALAFGLILAAFTACKKKEDKDKDPDPVDTTPVASTPPTPKATASSIDGALVAANLFTTYSTSYGGFTSEISFEIGTATASFYDAPNGSNIVNAGTVKCNDTTLTTTGSSNSYIYTPKASANSTADQGIPFSGGSNWSVTGNSGTGVPAFTVTLATFPSEPKISESQSKEISRSSAYTISLTSAISNADSICYQITSTNKTIYKILAGNTTSHTFSASELGELANHDYAVVSVTGYKLSTHTPASTSKLYALINLSSTNKTVKIKD